MRRSVVLAILVVVFAGLLLSGLTDNTTSVADTSVPNNEVASSVSKASNSYVSATITITMYTGDDK